MKGYLLMKKTNELFKILIPVLLAATAIAVVFASLALCLTYSIDNGNIDMKSPYAVLFVTTMLIALIAPIVIVVLFKELKITRTKRDLPFGKISAVLFLISTFVYTLSDMVFMVSSSFQIWRFLRALVAIFVMIFAILEFLPSKIKVSPFAKNFLNGCVPVYTALSIMAIYFNPQYLPEYFKILYIIAYAAITLFFLYDFKWRLVPTNAKAYTAISTMGFTLPVIISLTSIVGFFFKGSEFSQDNITISIFEMFFLCTLGIYALSKVFAVKKTVAYVVVETEKRRLKKELKERQRQAEEDAKFEILKAQIDAKNAEKAKQSKDNTENE